MNLGTLIAAPRDHIVGELFGVVALPGDGATSE
jgi:hypothetical protein